MSILALDLALNLGWAVLPADGQVMHGTVSFKPGRFEGGGMAWVRFRAWLDEMAKSCAPIERVYFEEVRRHTGTSAAHIHGGFIAHLTAWCEAQQPPIPYQGIPVQTIKRSATGKGNASKDAVIAAMRAMGFDPTDDNDADALALLMCIKSGMHL